MRLRERIGEQPPAQIQAMRERIRALYQQGSSSAQHDGVLNTAFEELTLALEELQAADERLRQQHEQWLNSRAELDLESQRYKDLFNHAPAGYLVTSIDGTIRQANAIAAALLQSTERSLVGRALALFLPEGQRRVFRTMLAQLAQSEAPQEWELTMQSWAGAPFEAGLTASVLRGATGRPVALYWLMRDIGARKRGDKERSEPSEYQDHDALARRQFAFLAEISPLLMIARDLDMALMQVARLAVPAIADGIIVDIAVAGSGAIHQLAVVAERHADGQLHTFQRDYTPETSARRQTRRTARAEEAHIAAPPTEPLLANLAPDAELRAILEALAPTSAIVVPLQARGAPRGSLTLLLSSTERQYGATDLALAEELAHRIAIVVERTGEVQAL